MGWVGAGLRSGRPAIALRFLVCKGGAGDDARVAFKVRLTFLDGLGLSCREDGTLGLLKQ